MRQNRNPGICLFFVALLMAGCNTIESNGQGGPFVQAQQGDYLEEQEFVAIMTSLAIQEEPIYDCFKAVQPPQDCERVLGELIKGLGRTEQDLFRLRLRLSEHRAGRAQPPSFEGYQIPNVQLAGEIELFVLYETFAQILAETSRDFERCFSSTELLLSLPECVRLVTSITEQSGVQIDYTIRRLHFIGTLVRTKRDLASST